MTEDDMFTTLVLPRARVGTLRTLQRAVQLFDRITTLPCQVRAWAFVDMRYVKRDEVLTAARPSLGSRRMFQTPMLSHPV